MTDEHLRSLERTDWPRYRAQLLRLGRLDDAGLATGDLVSVFQNPEQFNSGPQRYEALVWHGPDVDGDRGFGLVPVCRWPGFPESWKVGPGEMDNRPLYLDDGHGVKLLVVGPGQREDAVPRGEWGDHGLHDALVVHYRDHPLLGEKPLGGGLYRTRFDPREDCEFCSAGKVVVDRRRARDPDLSTLEQAVFSFSPSFPELGEYLLFRPPIDAVVSDPFPRYALSEGTGTLAGRVTAPGQHARDPIERARVAQARTRENVRRRPPRRI